MGTFKHGSWSLALALGVSVMSAQAQLASAQATAHKLPKAALRTAPAAIELSAQESAVLDQLHATHVLEIAAAKLALKHATSAEVRKHGQHLVKDLTQADRELTTIAKRNGVELSHDESEPLDVLRGLRGAQFDRAYLEWMVQDHQAAIDTVRAAQTHARNDDVRALLNKTLPTLQKHERRAQALSGEQNS